MRHYLRCRASGGTYFFTVNLAERRGNSLLVDRIAALRDAFRITRAERPFELQAIVVLPEHLHCLWRLPEGDADYSTRWRLIKSRFSRALPANERRTRSRRGKGERGIWQRRYWEHLVRGDADFRHHLDYIHFNPVRHGYVRSPGEWPHSSFQHWVMRGVYAEDWGGNAKTGVRVDFSCAAGTS
jgi:putative transposase